MEFYKPFVVLNADKFIELCEKKLGDNITADDYILFESFKDEKIHLVPRFTYILYIENRKINYDIYINIKNEWIEKNIVDIDCKDVEELLDDDVVVNIEDYEKFKNKIAFQITNNALFIDKFFEKLTDSEACAFSKKSKHNIFLIEDKNSYTIYVENEKICALDILPFTKLDKNDILYLINNDAIKNVKCKVNSEDAIINISNTNFNIMINHRDLQEPLVLARNNRYVAKTNVKINDSMSLNKIVTAYGNTPVEAKQRLKEKIQNLLSRETNSRNITFEMYKHLIKPHDDKDY